MTLSHKNEPKILQLYDFILIYDKLADKSRITQGLIIAPLLVFFVVTLQRSKLQDCFIL